MQRIRSVIARPQRLPRPSFATTTMMVPTSSNAIFTVTYVSHVSAALQLDRLAHNNATIITAADVQGLINRSILLRSERLEAAGQTVVEYVYLLWYYDSTHSVPLLTSSRFWRFFYGTLEQCRN